MISPHKIKCFAKNKYKAFLTAWFNGESLFPMIVSGGKSVPVGTSLAALNEWTESLEENSKKRRGFGYTVEWHEVKKRHYGRQALPKSITIDSKEDFLRLTGRHHEFQKIEHVVHVVRRELPELNEWLQRNLHSVGHYSDDIDALVETAKYFLANPRPDCFLREIQVSSDTKFIEQKQNRKVLGKWLDTLLPFNAVSRSEKKFERRYGLRYAEPMPIVRFLDKRLEAKAGFPCSVVALPLHSLGSLPLYDVRCIVVENKVNLLTLPSPIENAIALGGLGNGATMFQHVPWMVQSDETMLYWGDVDVEGFHILAKLRTLFPRIRSAMMDVQTLNRFSNSIVPGNNFRLQAPFNLTESEREAFIQCSEKNQRLEQERITHSYAIERLTPFLC